MANPIQGLIDWLHGADLQPRQTAEAKALTIDDIRAAITVGTLVHGPGATAMVSAAHGDDANSAVYACLSAIVSAYTEAPIQVRRMTGDRDESIWLDTHPAQVLLDAPNPHMDGPSVLGWVQWAKHTHGNAYLRKVRSGNPDTGNVVQLWPVSPRLVEPVTERGSGDFVSYYRYQYAPGKWEPIAPHNMIHFRLGLDDADMRVGVSPLKRLAREVGSDTEATAFADALLRNYGVPGLVVTTAPGVEMDATRAADLKDKIGSAFGAENRGRVGVLTNGATMQAFGFSPESLQLNSLHRIPEERISAVLRVPAIVAGLGAGLERSTFANFAEARAMFVEQTIMSLYRADAATLTQQLLADFTRDRDIRITFATDEIRALQDDTDALYTRLDVGVRGGWIAVDEARAQVGLPPMGSGDADSTPQKALAALLEIKAQQPRAADFPVLLQSLMDLAEPSLARDLDEYLDGQRRRVKRALVSGQ